MSLTKQKRVFSKFLPKEIHKIKIYQEMIYNKKFIKGTGFQFYEQILEAMEPN